MYSTVHHEPGKTTSDTTEEKQGIIWKIDRYTTHDGPGFRTLTFFKGCPLRCKWCSNVEGQTIEPDLVFIAQRCSFCEICVPECPNQAISMKKVDGRQKAKLQINRTKCNLCGVCVEACPTNALEIWGKGYSVSELIEILERDRIIHKKTGGGLTITGGDPIYHGKFVLKLLEACRRQGIHTAVETCAYADEEIFRSIVEQLDWLFIDLKHMDSQMHQGLTGKSNDLIIDNTKMASSILKARSKTLVVRITVIPGINDAQNMQATADFLRSLPLVTRVELLPYHRYGVYKYELLGRSYSLKNVELPTPKQMEGYEKLMKSRGLVVA